MVAAEETRAPRRSGWQRAATTPANDGGLSAGLLGVLAGETLSIVILAAAAGLTGHPNGPSGLARDVLGWVGLWSGFAGTALVACSKVRGRGLRERLSVDLGFSFRPLDVPLGVAVGLIGQFALVPVFELPLLPFVPHLYERLGQPAKSLTAHMTTPELVVLGLFVCVGSPCVEELLFRGLLFRGVLGSLRDRRGWQPGAAVAVSALASGLVFGLVHFEALELIALAGFGVVLALLAGATGRLGAGVIAHLTFNTATFLALALAH